MVAAGNRDIRAADRDACNRGGASPVFAWARKYWKKKRGFNTYPSQLNGFKFRSQCWVIGDG